MDEIEEILRNVYAALASGEVTREQVADLIGEVAVSEYAERMEG